MPGNTSPIFSSVGLIGQAKPSAANTSSAGGGTIGTDIFLLTTAGANGSWVERVRFMLVATAAGTTTTAMTARIFVSTKASGATSGGTDTFLYAEMVLPAITVDQASTGVSPFEVPMNFILPTGYTLLVTIHVVPAANTQVHVHSIGGSY